MSGDDRPSGATSGAAEHPALVLGRRIAASPSPYHVVANAAALLERHGFVEQREDEPWRTAPAAYVRRGGALVAWRVHGDGSAASGPPGSLRLVGAHTDSPNLRLKPRPDAGAFGWKQLAVEVYGGVLLNSWLDRDLGLSGRLALRSGEVRLVVVDRPVARVPQLAIHLDREVNDRGLVLDRQQHLAPVWGLGAARDGEVLELVAEAAGVAPGEVLAFDLMLHDLTPAALLGAAGELLACPRLDNQASCWSAIDALVGVDPGDAIAMVCLFDHEEVGSASTTGADGPLLRTVVERIAAAHGHDVDSTHRMLARSSCVSADNAHALHPNYPERHDPGHRPMPNAGPAVKVNANQRYATDAVSAARFVRACEAAGVPWQTFVSKNTMPCGSTIGPVTANRLGIGTVDVGIPQLSMHSARELCGADDPAHLTAALGAFLAGA